MLTKTFSRILQTHKAVFGQYGGLSFLARSNLPRPQTPVTTRSSAVTTVTSLLDHSACSSSPAYNVNQMRTVKYAYRPNALKRIKKFGLEKRINSNQQEILFNKFLKGRHQLTVFDRFLNEVPKKPVKTKKRVQLSNKTEGFRAYVKKPEYYKL